MTTRQVTRWSVGFMFLALCAGNASAQTSLGWGHHVPPYGYGYIGNVPNTVPQTTYFRGPGVAGYAPTTAMYAPRSVPAVNMPMGGGYAPNVSYRVGTPNAAAYTTAYSPIVTPSTPYAATWQYPPQTVMPTVANYAPAGYANYAAPVPPYYTTNYASVPVTYYRPVTAYQAGTAQTVLQPCVGAECQTRRHHGGFLSWLFGHHHTAPVATVPAAVPVSTIPAATVPTLSPPVVTNYPCPPTTTACPTNACPAPATTTQPYYTPGAGTTVVPGGASVPANTVPSLSAPPPTYPGATTVSPPLGSSVTPMNPGTTIVPGAINSSGAARADYPPVVDPYTPNVSPQVPLSTGPVIPLNSAPVIPLAPITPGTLDALNGTNGNGTNGNGANGNGSNGNGTPADQSPSLKPPANDEPVGNGLQNESNGNNNGNGGAYLRPLSPQYPINSQPMPRATIRRDSNITPIPDPEYRGGTKVQMNKAPQLISPRDKTAQATSPDARLASFEEPAAAVKPAPAAKPAARPVLGDDIWKSGK